MSKQMSFNFEPKRISQPTVFNFAKHNAPVFKEVRGEDVILFGVKNDYPNYLIDLYNKSAKHNAIINNKVKYTTGNGYEIVGIEEETLKLKSFLENINAEGEDFDELISKINLDLEIFGGFYCEVIWSKSGKQIASIKHIDFSHVRSNKDNTEFYYTKNWLTDRGHFNKNFKDEKDFVTFQVFNPEKGKGSQLFYYKSYRPNVDVYATPEYTGAIEYIEIDTLISNHHYNNIKNGFVGNVMINFLNGVPTEEEQAIIEKKVQEKFTGSDGQRVLINFADGEEQATKIDFLTHPDVYKSMTDLNESVQQEILTGHNIVSGMLVGIKTEGQLGGRSEMIDAYELMKATYVKPKQKILEKAFNYLFSFGYVGKVNFVNAQPIADKLSEETLTQIMTRSELREREGLEVEPEAVKVEGNKTMDALNSMSPLVATKVLESLSIDEIRSLAGINKPAEQQLSSHRINEVLSAFDEYGESKEKFNIISARALTFESVQDANDDLVLQFADQYSAVERGILDLLKEDELMSEAEMAKVLDVSEKEVKKAVQGLVKSGDLKVGKAWSGDQKIPKYKVTESGVRVVKEKPSKAADIYVKYSYEVIGGMGKPIIPTTRDFCRELIQKDKLYTREDIEKISAKVGYNVFDMRGGWYTQKNGVPVPHCRHQWQQVIVTSK